VVRLPPNPTPTMSRTYAAELAHWRLADLHPRYLDRVEELRETPSHIRRRNICYETMCPYCGIDAGQLTAKVRVGAKKLVTGVRLTPQGFKITGVGTKSTELLIIHCGTSADDGTLRGCGAAIDPIAYLSPIVFVNDKLTAEEILNS
jgi:hypothetical protein